MCERRDLEQFAVAAERFKTVSFGIALKTRHLPDWIGLSHKHALAQAIAPAKKRLPCSRGVFMR
jgi:hypothetical protein